MVIDLIVFDMSYFDIILRMDFLSCYRVEIDCRKKKVQFQLDDDEKFTFWRGSCVEFDDQQCKTQKDTE